MILFVIVSLSSLSSLSLDREIIRTGSSEMLRLFQRLGVEYISVNNFVEAFNGDEFPGGDLVTRTPDSKFSILEARDLWPNFTYIGFDEQIQGHGLFAFQALPAGTILGLYTGEVQHTLTRGEIPLVVPKARRAEIVAGGGFVNFPHWFFASWFRPGHVLFSFNENSKYSVALIHPFHAVRIQINAYRHGNELRFINHAQASEANCKYKMVFISYQEFLQLSRKPDWLELARTIEGEELYIPVVVVETLREIGAGEQFTIDYGEDYWVSSVQELGISPKPVTPRISYRLEIPEIVLRFLAAREIL